MGKYNPEDINDSEIANFLRTREASKQTGEENIEGKDVTESISERIAASNERTQQLLAKAQENLDRLKKED